MNGLEVPTSAKITFGWAQGRGPAVRELRIYESGNRQIACFTNVHSFFDDALKLTKLVKVGDQLAIPPGEVTANVEF